MVQVPLRVWSPGWPDSSHGMSVGPRLFPIDVAANDGSVSLNGALGIVTYDDATMLAARLQIYDRSTTLVLDVDVAELIEGAAPTMVHGRHKFILADGRELDVLMERGCACGNRLKFWRPSEPATSGRRP